MALEAGSSLCTLDRCSVVKIVVEASLCYLFESVCGKIAIKAIFSGQQKL